MIEAVVAVVAALVAAVSWALFERRGRQAAIDRAALAAAQSVIDRGRVRTEATRRAGDTAARDDRDAEITRATDTRDATRDALEARRAEIDAADDAAAAADALRRAMEGDR